MIEISWRTLAFIMIFALYGGYVIGFKLADKSKKTVRDLWRNAYYKAVGADKPEEAEK